MSIKVVKFLFLLMSIILFSGCTQSTAQYILPEESVKQQSNEIMEALISNDEQSFKELLCQAIKDNHTNLDEEIQELFCFIDGDIVSFDEPEGSPAGGTTTPEEGWVKRFVEGRITHITTNTNKVYNITYNLNLINKDQPELMGISYIYVVVDGAEYDPVAGYAPEDSCSIVLE